MVPHTDTNWWDFMIDDHERQESDHIIRGAGEVNPQTADGRYLLDYHQYIGLDKLLTSQAPSTRIPDERIFIITHQLFELIFKQMIFDLGVLARTFENLLARDNDAFKLLCEGGKRSGSWIESFWRPAVHASGRLQYSSLEVLPTILSYVDQRSPGRKAESVELFHQGEFKKFRENLIPASGFQTAQFRLISRALGKSNLLRVNVFPSWKFEKCYLGRGQGAGLPLSLSDPLLLGAGDQIANPPPDSPLAAVAMLDDRAHEVLGRLSPQAREPANQISDDDESTSALTESYERMLAKILEFDDELKSESAALAKQSAEQFRPTWIAAIEGENERRRLLSAARGAADLPSRLPDSFLTCTLGRIVRADRGLHGDGQSDDESFLTKHLLTARRQIGRDDGGTSGGGTLYLEFSIPGLFHKFPALVHYEKAVAR